MSPHAILAFMTIAHASLAEPVRLVSDTLNYSLGGFLYIGMLFGWRILDDNEGSAQTEIVLPDTDRRIGEAIRSVSGDARVSVELMSSEDFDLSVVPRVPTVTPQVIYGFYNLVLLSASADGQQITCPVGLRDYAQEPWPSISATEIRLPGLFR